MAGCGCGPPSGDCYAIKGTRASSVRPGYTFEKGTARHTAVGSRFERAAWWRRRSMLGCSTGTSWCSNRVSSTRTPPIGNPGSNQAGGGTRARFAAAWLVTRGSRCRPMEDAYRKGVRPRARGVPARFEAGRGRKPRAGANAGLHGLPSARPEGPGTWPDLSALGEPVGLPPPRRPAPPARDDAGQGSPRLGSGLFPGP
jgi:hypothetical protein